jgi:hypothetical protein
VQSQRLEELPQFSTMVRDRENTFCTSGTYKSANQSQSTTLFSQPIIIEYTILHNAEGQGEHILHIEHLQVSQPITNHYFIQPTNHNRVYSSPSWCNVIREQQQIPFVHIQAIKPKFDSNPRGAINFIKFAAVNYQLSLINDPVS